MAKAKKQSPAQMTEQEASALLGETKPETVTFEVEQTEVNPMATAHVIITDNVEKVKLIQVSNGRIVAHAVKRKLAERLVQNNPKIKIG